MTRENEYQLVETCRRLSGLGMMPASDGNCSVRLDENSILITPTGIRKEQLKPRDLVQLDINDEDVSANASSEWRMHASIYREKSETKAIIHAHPVYLIAWGLRGEAPDSGMLYETAETIGEITVIDAGTPGTESFAEQVAQSLGDAVVGILTHHGAMSIGGDLEEALFRLERAEHLAQIALL